MEIGRGVVFYIAFTKEATAASVEQAVAELVDAVLVPSAAEPTTKVTLLQADADVLVIPQASLAGKLKQHRAQYGPLVFGQSTLNMSRSSFLTFLFSEIPRLDRKAAWSRAL